MSDQFLVKIDRATQILASCDSIKQVKDHASMAAAAKVWAKRTKASARHRNYATAFELRCERRLGELLSGMEKNNGTAGAGRPKIGGTRRVPPNGHTTLAEIGISKNESSRAQKLAKLNGHHFETVVSQLQSVEDREVPKTTVVEALSKPEKTDFLKAAEANSKREFPYKEEFTLVHLIEGAKKMKSLDIKRIAEFLKETPTGRKHTKNGDLDFLAWFWPSFIKELKEHL